MTDNIMGHDQTTRSTTFTDDDDDFPCMCVPGITTTPHDC